MERKYIKNPVRFSSQKLFWLLFFVLSVLFWRQSDGTALATSDVIEGQGTEPLEVTTSPSDIPKTPTLHWPTSAAITIDKSPKITGWAQSGFTVKIYIDNNYSGFVISTADPSGTGSFAYHIPDALSLGLHTVQVVTLNDRGDPSPLSSVISFFVEDPSPVPTIVRIADLHSSKPTIVAKAMNNSIVKIYIDKVFQGEVVIQEEGSEGEVEFEYIPFAPLSKGSHTVSMTLQDVRGKPSVSSSGIQFISGKPSLSQISQLFQVEDKRDTNKTGVKDKKSSPSTPSLFYSVQAGDSLWKIAKNYYKDGKKFPEIINLNKDRLPSLVTNPSLLQIGWELLLK